MRALVADHGLNVIGVKSNLYTAIGKTLFSFDVSDGSFCSADYLSGPCAGLDSKHPSGIQSTVSKPILVDSVHSTTCSDGSPSDLEALSSHSGC